MKQLSPIAIGGLGGSGTRIIAEILMRSGVFLGDRLNTPSDNLWFTVLFVQQRLFRKKGRDRNEIIRQSLDLFCRKMSGIPVFSSQDILFLHEAAESYANTRDFFGSPQNFVSEFISEQSGTENLSAVWGWKEPNTHIYLDYLMDFFSDLRYIHIVRHGLDMAYSQNQNQLIRWGPRFGFQYADSDNISPLTAFEFWQTMNQRAISLARNLPEERFLLVYYEDLCNSPETGVKKITDFLGLSLSSKLMQSIIELPSPVSIGRYQNHDLSWVGEKQKQALESLGFTQ